MAIDLGPLDHRITLQRAGGVVDEYNERTDIWETLATVGASVFYARDSERFANGVETAAVEVRFVIRRGSPWSDLSPKDRVLFKGETFQIVGVKPLGRNVGFEISARAAAD